MKLNTIAVFFATLAQVHAAAIPATNASSLVLYHTRILDVGTLEYWGIPQLQGAASVASVANAFDWDAGWGNSEVEAYAPAPAPIQARCGSNQYHCADSNLADASVCASLISVFAKNRRGGIDPNVRGVLHYNNDGGSCVISWHDYVPNMVNGYLVTAASKILWGCGIYQTRVSGYANDVSLNGVCTTQCMSSARNCF
jgi:hypothetical protein